MLTVTLGLEESGKRRTWSPWGRAYSVMPSTAVIFRTPWGRVWESAVKAKIRRSGSNALLRVMSHLDIWGFRRIITGDVWAGRDGGWTMELQQAFDAGGEFQGVEGLDDVVVGAEFEAAENVALVLAGRQHDDLQGKVRLANGGEHFEAVHTGHVHVEHGGLRTEFAD